MLTPAQQKILTLACHGSPSLREIARQADVSWSYARRVLRKHGISSSGRPGGPHKRLDHDAMIRDRKAGMGFKEIAAKHGCVYSAAFSVTFACTPDNIAMGEPNMAKRGQKITIDDIMPLLDQNLAKAEIARRLGVGSNTIFRLLNKHGITKTTENRPTSKGPSEEELIRLNEEARAYSISNPSLARSATSLSWAG